MRTLIFGVQLHTFIADWAQSVGRFSDVASLELVNDLDGAWRVDHYGDLPRVLVRPFRLRPGRVLGPVNTRVMTRRYKAAIDAIVHDVGPIDVVHTHFYMNAYPIVRACQMLGIPVVHTEHSSSLSQHARERGRGPSRPGRRMVRYVSSRSAATLCVSEGVRREMESHGARGRLLVVPNPVWGGGVTIHPRPRSPMRLVTIGWLEAHKGHALLVEAFARACEARGDLYLTVIGDGSLERYLEDEAARLGIESRVNFVGRVSRAEVFEWLSRGHLYVHASEGETFGVALAEAWLSGLRVVAIAAGGLTERVEHYGGTLVRRRSAGDLADGILAELSMAEYVDRHALAHRVGQEFSVEGVSAMIRPIFLEACESVSRAGHGRATRAEEESGRQSLSKDGDTTDGGNDARGRG